MLNGPDREAIQQKDPRAERRDTAPGRSHDEPQRESGARRARISSRPVDRCRPNQLTGCQLAMPKPCRHRKAETDMPKVTFIIDGEAQTVEFEHGQAAVHASRQARVVSRRRQELRHCRSSTPAAAAARARPATSSSAKGTENLSEMQDDEADRLDTAWGLTARSRLGCQAVITGDVVCELPMYTRNYVQEGGGIQLGKSDTKERKAQEVTP